MAEPRDDLGLRRALGDRMLPLLVAAMAFLACLAGAGVLGARALAVHWRGGAQAALTAQVPRPDEPVAPGGPTRLARVLELLRADPGVLEARPLAPGEVAALLQPWFGAAGPPADLPLPAVVDVRLAPGGDLDRRAAALRQALAAVADAVIDGDGEWTRRLDRLASSLQACAWLALAVVAAVSALMVAAATRGGLVARREAIALAHGLGATDAYIAVRFARRATLLALLGATGGTLAALPVLAALSGLAAPFLAAPAAPVAWWGALPPDLWLGLPALPLAAAGIGYATAQATVRRWLRSLP